MLQLIAGPSLPAAIKAAMPGRFTLDLTPPIISVQSIVSMSENTCLGSPEGRWKLSAGWVSCRAPLGGHGEVRYKWL